MHQCIDRALVHTHVEQAVTSHVQRDGVASGQRHAAELGGNHAVVADIGAQQRHIASIGGIDCALVQHCASAGSAEFVITGHEVGIGNGQTGCHQATDIDLSAFAKQDAVGVDQKHLAIGGQAAQDAGWVSAQHPVQSHGTAGGLYKLHRLAGGDIEALPVDDRVL